MRIDSPGADFANTEIHSYGVNEAVKRGTPPVLGQLAAACWNYLEMMR